MSRPRPLHSWTATLLVALPAIATIAVGSTTVPVASAAHPGSGASFAPGVVIVGFRAHTAASASRAALAHTGIERPSTPLAPFATVALQRGVSVASAIARLRQRADVAWAVPDYIAHAAQVPSPYIPNDPGNSGKPGGWQELQWNFAGPFGVKAPQAWANLAAAGHPGGSGVTVAVLDTGVAYANHGHYRRSPDFRTGEFVKGYDFVAHSPYPEDRNGHGTQVAGTIAEATNNRIGVTGLAYGVRRSTIMPRSSI
jgi:serine protease